MSSDTKIPRVVKNGRIKTAPARWCLSDMGEKWSPERVCQTAVALGCKAVEVVPAEEYPLLKKYGLQCALGTAHMFVRGLNNPLHWDECHSKFTKTIDANAEFGFRNIVTFTGFSDTTIPEPGARPGSKVGYEEGLRNCIEGYKKIVGYAEKKGSVLCLEALNTRDGADMKGHPGYQGDHFDFCLEVVNKVGSPALKLCLDYYHVQIMDGDLIRRTRALKAEQIGHVQVAGVPGRGELDKDQEVNWPAVMKALLAIGYDGYVGLEFIPVRDPLQGLIEAITLLDV